MWVGSITNTSGERHEPMGRISGRHTTRDDRSRVAYVESPCPLSEPGPLNRSPSVSVGIKSEPIDAPTISVIGS